MRNPAAHALVRAAVQLETEAKALRATAERIDAAERRPDDFLKRRKEIHRLGIEASEHPENIEHLAASYALPTWLLKQIAARERDVRVKKIVEGRDMQMVRMARKGRSNGEIAITFGVSSRTVARALKRARELV